MLSKINVDRVVKELREAITGLPFDDEREAEGVMSMDNLQEGNRMLSDLYTQIRVVNENGITVAVIDEYDCTPIAEGYTVVLRPKYD